MCHFFRDRMDNRVARVSGQKAWVSVSGSFSGLPLPVALMRTWVLLPQPGPLVKADMSLCLNMRVAAEESRAED